MPTSPPRRTPGWLTGSVIGIVLSTFFSDVGHEAVTAILPLYLGSIGLGAAALGMMEGLADLLFSLSKLGGGWVGQRSEKKRALGTLGYLATAVATGAMALFQSLAGLMTLRSLAWVGRGFRSPLRDFMLADEVGPTHFGRAYGVERAADMLGAVAGPLLAVLLVWLGVELRSIILLSLVPSALAVLAFYGLTRDRTPAAAKPPGPGAAKLPRAFWLFLGGVTLFGMGDFSRTFLIFLAASALGADGTEAAGTFSTAVLLYALHNVVSAIAAYPAGRFGDRGSKLAVLIFGYGLGVATNGLLAFTGTAVAGVVLAIGLSGIYIAIEETLEKAVAAEMLPREQRSLGLGVLASANAVGDMVSSVTVGALLAAGWQRTAFLVPAGLGLLGVLWMLVFARRRASSPAPA